WLPEKICLIHCEQVHQAIELVLVIHQAVQILRVRAYPPLLHPVPDALGKRRCPHILKAEAAPLSDKVLERGQIHIPYLFNAAAAPLMMRTISPLISSMDSTLSMQPLS